MNKVEAIRKSNETELKLGIAGTRFSWHQKYETCPFIYVGGLPTAITEGDLLAMFEQYGIVVHINLVRDSDTGKSRGFAFLKYHDPRSAVLAVDNFTGTEVAGRTLRVDHAEDYTVPEDGRQETIDTTPPELQTQNSDQITVATGAKDSAMDDVNVANSEELKAEARREKAVLERLRSMRKQRARELKRSRRSDDSSKKSGQMNEASVGESPKEEEVAPESSNGHHRHEKKNHGVSLSRIEKRRRKQEREDRKAERARIREERRRRRSEREEND